MVPRPCRPHSLQAPGRHHRWKTYEFTSQLFFDDAFIDGIQAQPPYAAKGKRTLRNAGDGIYNQSKGLTLLNVTKSGSAYAATFEVGVQL